MPVPPALVSNAAASTRWQVARVGASRASTQAPYAASTDGGRGRGVARAAGSSPTAARAAAASAWFNSFSAAASASTMGYRDSTSVCKCTRRMRRSSDAHAPDSCASVGRLEGSRVAADAPTCTAPAEVVVSARTTAKSRNMRGRWCEKSAWRATTMPPPLLLGSDATTASVPSAASPPSPAAPPRAAARCATSLRTHTGRCGSARLRRAGSALAAGRVTGGGRRPPSPAAPAAAHCATLTSLRTTTASTRAPTAYWREMREVGTPLDVK